VIQGRICMASRNKASGWAEVYKPHEWAKQARSEIAIRMHAVVVVGKEDNDTNIEDLARELESQTLPLRHTWFVIREGGFKRAGAVRKILESLPKLKWTVVSLFDKEPDGSPPLPGRCIDEAVKRMDPSDCQFYAVFSPSSSVAADFVEDVDKLVNDNLERFVLLTPPDSVFDGLVVSYAAHCKVGGFALAEYGNPDSEAGVTRCDHVWNKLGIVASEENQNYLIRQYGERCQTTSPS
jgi:hypothetical protein